MHRLLPALLFPAVVFAHGGSLRYGSVRVGEREVRYDLRIRGTDLAEPLGLDAGTLPSPGQVGAEKERALDYVSKRDHCSGRNYRSTGQ